MAFGSLTIGMPFVSIVTSWPGLYTKRIMKDLISTFL